MRAPHTVAAHVLMIKSMVWPKGAGGLVTHLHYTEQNAANPLIESFTHLNI